MKLSLKYKVLMIVILSVFTAFSLYYFVTKLQQEQAVTEALIDYRNITREYGLDAVYKSKEYPIEVELYPTAHTEAILERWKAISERYPELDYPKAAIEAEDWLTVEESLEDTDVLKEVVDQMYEDSTIPPEGAGASFTTLFNYIKYHQYDTQYIEEVLIDLGIEPLKETD
ncbi:hypothetical protein [Amphibacillus cookii]|uniref:hypothetical protein n=1 Tax=Amphibacillus cookii TaxID=767787 RepID=UPI0019561D15|nr:hypothetical protein [Amphibacillus cookii]MBM7539831.1 type II secretory pathway pseudopilin PulG [Amphibacillus cookii]